MVLPAPVLLVKLIGWAHGLAFVVLRCDLAGCLLAWLPKLSGVVSS